MPPRARHVALAETVEDGGKKVRSDAAPRVADDQTYALTGPFHLQFDAPAFGRKLDRVLQQVPDHLPQPRRVTYQLLWRSANLRHKVDLFSLGGRAHYLDGLFQHQPQVCRREFEFEFAADDARHVEQVFDQFLLHSRVALDDLAVARDHRRVLRFGARHPNVAENGAERRTHFV